MSIMPRIRRQVTRCRDGLVIGVTHTVRPLCAEDAAEACSAVEQAASCEWPLWRELVEDDPAVEPVPDSLTARSTSGTLKVT